MSKVLPLLRVCGAALLIAAVTLFIDGFIHGGDEVVGRMLTVEWKWAHILEGAGYLALALGLVGIYLRQAEQVGKFGLFAFVLAFIGAVHTMGVGLIYHAYLLPFMAKLYPVLLSPAQWYAPDGPLGAEVAYVSKLYLLTDLGLILLSAATLRARVFPRWPAGLMLFGRGVFLFFFGFPALAAPLFPLMVAGFLAVTGAYFGFGWALLGFQREGGPAVLQPARG